MSQGLTKSAGMSFDAWWEALIALAKERDVLWVLSSSKEDHREGYEDDETPEDELWTQLDAAADLQ